MVSIVVPETMMDLGEEQAPTDTKDTVAAAPRLTTVWSLVKVTVMYCWVPVTGAGRDEPLLRNNWLPLRLEP